MTKKQLYKKYPYIVAWGKYMGSMDYYIEAQCVEADEAGAPTTACYYSTLDEKWRTKDNIKPDVLFEVEKYINEQP